MSYAIIGFGKIGQALARAFARSGIEVSVATTRDPTSFASEVAAIGPGIIAKALAEAVKTDTLFLAVRFESHPEVAKALSSWKGKMIVDVMNTSSRWKESTGHRHRIRGISVIDMKRYCSIAASCDRAPAMPTTSFPGRADRSPKDRWKWRAHALAGTYQTNRSRRLPLPID
ncbi:pyrroline-5-carboxylate reductase [Paraburkholderia sp. GAS41]|jgi:pyrroline-5-carboxylate reductase